MRTEKLNSKYLFVFSVFEKASVLFKFLISIFLLASVDYAVFGYFSLIISLFDSLTRFGLEEAFYRSARHRMKWLSSLFSFNVFRGAACVALLIGSLETGLVKYISPSLIDFYVDNSFLVFFACFSVFFDYCKNPSIYLQRKLLNYRPFYIHKIVQISVGILVLSWGGIVGSVDGLLFIAYASANFAAGVFSYAYKLPVIKFKIFIGLIKNEITFFKSFYVLVVVTFLASYVDRFIVGQFVDLDTVGVYFLCMNIMSVALGQTSKNIADFSKNYIYRIVGGAVDKRKPSEVGRYMCFSIRASDLFIYLSYGCIGLCLFLVDVLEIHFISGWNIRVLLETLLYLCLFFKVNIYLSASTHFLIASERAEYLTAFRVIGLAIVIFICFFNAPSNLIDFIMVLVLSNLVATLFLFRKALLFGLLKTNLFKNIVMVLVLVISPVASVSLLIFSYFLVWSVLQLYPTYKELRMLE